jgi:hypothetical protein
MITPCVMGLYNGGVLEAMYNNGIKACVSDESVPTGTVDYELVTPYHGVYSQTTPNGFVCLFPLSPSCTLLVPPHMLTYILGWNVLRSSRGSRH